jgi:hypothetical protein
MALLHQIFHGLLVRFLGDYQIGQKMHPSEKNTLNAKEIENRCRKT